MGKPLSGNGLYDGRADKKWKTILVGLNSAPVNRCFVVIRKPRMTVMLRGTAAAAVVVVAAAAVIVKFFWILGNLVSVIYSGHLINVQQKVLIDIIKVERAWHPVSHMKTPSSRT